MQQDIMIISTRDDLDKHRIDVRQSIKSATEKGWRVSSAVTTTTVLRARTSCFYEFLEYTTTICLMA